MEAIKTTLSTIGYPIIVFDGHCPLCCRSVRFIIRHDRKRVFRFAPISKIDLSVYLSKDQSSLAASRDTLILVESGKMFMESDAVLRIVRKLNFPWRLFVVFYIIPRFVRDFFYRQLAKRREKWFGRNDMCWIPDKDVTDLFIN